MSCGLGSRSRPSVEFLSHEWLLTLGTPLVDPRKRQTSTATPAKPGGLPLTLGGLFRHVVDLAGEQAARGHDVGMFFDSDGLCPRVDNALATVPGGLRLGVKTACIHRHPGTTGRSACFAASRPHLRPIV